MVIATPNKSDLGSETTLQSQINYRVMHLCLRLDMGGAEVLAVQMVNNQAERSFQSPVLAMLGPSSSTLLAGKVSEKVYCKELGMQSRLNWQVVANLRRLIRQTDTKVIHAHNPAPLLAAVAACIGLDTRIVYTHHGSGITKQYSKNKLLRYLLLHRTAGLVGVSPEATDALKQSFGGRIDASRFQTILNGIDVSNFASSFPTHEMARELLNLDESPVIGYVGRFSPEKRVDLLIDAIGTLCQRGERLQLLLLGDGQLRSDLERQARTLGFIDKIRFLGFRTDVISILPMFDIFVNCSRMEGISLGILEAMASGRAIVATAVGGTPLLIEHSVSGCLIPSGSADALAEAIQSLIRDHEMRTRFGQAAKQRAEEHFSFNAMMRQYEDVYMPDA